MRGGRPSSYSSLASPCRCTCLYPPHLFPCAHPLHFFMKANLTPLSYDGNVSLKAERNQRLTQPRSSAFWWLRFVLGFFLPLTLSPSPAISPPIVRLSSVICRCWLVQNLCNYPNIHGLSNDIYVLFTPPGSLRDVAKSIHQFAQ